MSLEHTYKDNSFYKQGRKYLFTHPDGFTFLSEAELFNGMYYTTNKNYSKFKAISIRSAKEL